MFCETPVYGVTPSTEITYHAISQNATKHWTLPRYFLQKTYGIILNRL